MSRFPDLNLVEGFDWDQGNIDKNWERHGVSFYECEEVFLRQPVLIPDTAHSDDETRYYALGATIRDRRLTLVFTLRKNKIRVISARSMSKKERSFYENTKKTA